MNTFKFLTVAALTFIFVSCSDSKSTVETANKEQTKTETQQNNDFSDQYQNLCLSKNVL